MEGPIAMFALGRILPRQGPANAKAFLHRGLPWGESSPGEILSRQGSANAKAASCIFPGENRPRGDPLQARVGKCESCFLHRGFPWGESSPGRSSPGKGRQMRKLLPASRVSLGRILPAKCESCFLQSGFCPYEESSPGKSPPPLIPP